MNNLFKLNLTYLENIKIELEINQFILQLKFFEKIEISFKKTLNNNLVFLCKNEKFDFCFYYIFEFWNKKIIIKNDFLFAKEVIFINNPIFIELDTIFINYDFFEILEKLIYENQIDYLKYDYFNVLTFFSWYLTKYQFFDLKIINYIKNYLNQ